MASTKHKEKEEKMTVSRHVFQEFEYKAIVLPSSALECAEKLNDQGTGLGIIGELEQMMRDKDQVEQSSAESGTVPPEMTSP